MKKSWLSSTWQLIFITGALLIALILSAAPHINALGAGGVIALVNAERAGAGLTPLSYNGALSTSAHTKAQDMLAKGYWAHTSPDGLTGWTFMSRAGYAYVAGGENLARDFGTEGAVVTGWMGSSGHRANVLNGSYRDIGVGIASGTLNGAPVTIVVAHFGATATAPAPAPAPNPAPQLIPAPAPAPKQTPSISPRSTPRTSVKSPSNTQTTPTEVEAIVQVTEVSELVLEDTELTQEIKEPKAKNPVDILIDSLVEIIKPGASSLIGTK